MFALIEWDWVRLSPISEIWVMLYLLVRYGKSEKNQKKNRKTQFHGYLGLVANFTAPWYREVRPCLSDWKLFPFKTMPIWDFKIGGSYDGRLWTEGWGSPPTPPLWSPATPYCHYFKSLISYGCDSCQLVFVSPKSGSIRGFGGNLFNSIESTPLSSNIMTILLFTSSYISRIAWLYDCIVLGNSSIVIS